MSDPDNYTLQVNDMTCAACVNAVERAIKSVPGVTQAQVNLVEKLASVQGGDPEAVLAAIQDAGYQVCPLKKPEASDKLHIRFDPQADQQSASALLPTLGTVTASDWPNFELDTHLHPADVLLTLTKQGLQAELVEQFDDPYQKQAQEATAEIRQSWLRALIAGSLGLGLMAVDMLGIAPNLHQPGGTLFWSIAALACLGVMFYSGKHYYRSAIKQAKHGAANMDSLVALGTSAAWISSVITLAWPDTLIGSHHLYLDASVTILAFLQLGHALEIRAKRTTSEAIGALVKLAPRTATLVRDDAEIELPVSALRAGDLIRCKPGQTLAADGEVTEGAANLDESMLTGEARAVRKVVGSQVSAGTRNLDGSLILRVNRTGEDSTLAHIIAMVRQAQMSKPPIARLADRISAVFVPSVILLAMLTFALWYWLGPEPSSAYALTTGIAVLVIACPCALGLATPIAVMVGTARAAQFGILARNADALQTASELTHLVVDKTGTLTLGRPMVTLIRHLPGLHEDQILSLAAALEIHSEHPLAQAVMASARARGVPIQPCQSFTTQPGLGIGGVLGDQPYFLGNAKLLHNLGVAVPADWAQFAEEQAVLGGSPIWLANSQQVLALILLNDPLRHDSQIAIDELKKLGVEVILCSGDHQAAVKATAQRLGIEQAKGGLRPEHKLEVVRGLQAMGLKVGMVGDGINDAPALAQADCGFAIGAGTDAAIASADVTLATSSLLGVANAIALSQGTLKNIKQNLLGAFIYNLAGIPLAAGLFYPITGWLLNPMFASLAMALSSVTVVSNANRLRFFQPKSGGQAMSNTINLSIQGMTCQHCVRHATKALQQVPGVESVEVTLEPGGAQVTGTANPNALIAAVKEAGYSAALNS